jgi:hypothetical protein
LTCSEQLHLHHLVYAFDEPRLDDSVARFPLVRHRSSSSSSSRVDGGQPSLGNLDAAWLRSSTSTMALVLPAQQQEPATRIGSKRIRQPPRITLGELFVAVPILAPPDPS